MLAVLRRGEGEGLDMLRAGARDVFACSMWSS